MAAAALRLSPSTTVQRSMISGSLSRSAFARSCFTSGVLSAAILSRVQLTDLLGIFAIMADFVDYSRNEKARDAGLINVPLYHQAALPSQKYPFSPKECL
jgi:hypothetical protein